MAIKNSSSVPIAVIRPSIVLLADGCFPGHESITTLVLSWALFGAMEGNELREVFLSHCGEELRAGIFGCVFT